MNLLEEGTNLLKKNNIDISLANYLYQYIDDKKNYIKGIKKIIKGIPVQQVIGNVDFNGSTIKINKDVLIPRFETEELVEKTINYITKHFNGCNTLVDLGTGSGCIAITLKKAFPNFVVEAVDISDKALKIAKYNAKKNDTDIKFYLGDMFKPLNKKYDMVISNPPYIGRTEEIMDLVKNNEPSIALFADNQGLKCYKDILKDAHKYLNKKNLISFEIGEKQSSLIKKMALKYYPDSKIVIEKDLQGRERFLFIFNNCE